MKSIEACFYERTKGVISRQFSHVFTILSENCSRFLPRCLWRGTPKLLAFSLLAYISEASFSARPSSQSEHNLTPDSSDENTDCCFLLGSQQPDPALLCEAGVVGSWCRLVDPGWDPGYTLCLWAVLFLPASPQSAEVTPQTTCPEHSIHVCLSSNPSLSGPWSSLGEQSKPL